VLDATQTASSTDDILSQQTPSYAEINAVYIEIAEKIAQFTRINHNQLTRIITTINTINQTT